MKIFPEADADWLHCVVGHRRKYSFEDVVQNCLKYDVIGGKIANDATNLTIVAYMLGSYGAIGSKQADDICISLFYRVLVRVGTGTRIQALVFKG